MSNLIPEGEHIAKPIQVQFVKSKDKGSKCIKVDFEIKHEGGSKCLDWNGWLSEKAKDMTMEQLSYLKCNFNYNSLNDNGQFEDPNFIDYNSNVTVVIFHEDFTKKDGTIGTGARINFIKPLAGGNRFKTVKRSEAISVLSSIFPDQGNDSLGIDEDEEVPF